MSRRVIFRYTLIWCERNGLPGVLRYLSPHNQNLSCLFSSLIGSQYKKTTHAFFTDDRKDKWDSSGGNEAIQRMSSAIPESTKSYVGGMFKREHLRSVSLFFGIGEERPFYVEKVPSLVMERVRHNISFFYLNYILLTAVLFCLTLFISPSAIIGLALLAMAWMWVIRSSQDGSLKIGSK